MKPQEVIETFERVLNWASERNKLSIDYGIGTGLCMSEIHVLELIGKHPGILQIQISEKMGLTKGRISVIISKLSKKELIIFIPGNSNKKEIPIFLSEKGRIAFENHQQKDMLIFQKMEHIISQYSTEEVEHFNQAVIQILNALREGYEQKDDTK